MLKLYTKIDYLVDFFYCGFLDNILYGSKYRFFFAWVNIILKYIRQGLYEDKNFYINLN